MVQSQELRIGAVARQAGVSVDTVRYYERRGLLRPAGRLPSGYRLYTETAVARIRLARQLQGLGMTLEEVGRHPAARTTRAATAPPSAGGWRRRATAWRPSRHGSRPSRRSWTRCSPTASKGRCDLLPNAVEDHGSAAQTADP